MASPIRGPPDGSMDQKSLTETLRTTTRPIHKRLNRLIMCRMPMALPPRASDPSIYATGLIHIAPIYMTFEALWQTVLTPPGGESDNSHQVGPAQGSDSRMHFCPISLEGFDKPALPLKLGLVLLKLALPGLRRTAALRSDLERLTGWSPNELDVELRRVVTSDGALRAFTTRIRETLEKRPHVLVSYAYIFYMALFAGGRIIRSTLESQVTSFWDMMPVSPAKTGMIAGGRDVDHTDATGDSVTGKTANETSHTCAFTSNPFTPVDFLRFDTPSDGEDLKEEFKRRLCDSESLLTENEKGDIIQEATVIFEEMLSVVQQLDELFEPDKPSNTVSVASGSSDATQESKITDRLRDSVVVTKERKERKGARRSGEAASDALPVLGEEEEGADAGGPSKAIRFCRDLEHVPAPVVDSPEKADFGPTLSSLDGADDEIGNATEKQGLLLEPQKQEPEAEGQEAEEGWSMRKMLPFFARVVIFATFTWLIVCLTAMLLGRSEPFRKGCPNLNPYSE
ncbi:hypothetical protein VUR80DRAFT_791 [Thermomyces stellatus]